MEFGEMSNKEEPQVEVPWVPSTPVKPILQNPDLLPIYLPGEQNQLPHHANGAIACPEFTVLTDKNNMPCDVSLPEATVAGDGGKTLGFGLPTFSELMLHAEKGTLNSNATQPGSSGLKIPFFPSLMPQFNGDSTVSDNHLSLESKIIQNNFQDPQGTSWSERTSQDSQFILDKEEKNPGSEEKNVPAEKLNNNGTTHNKEPDPVVEFGAASKTLEKNHPDTGSSLVIDLNKTPQQKPRTRRRKHRPKVITEGKPKRTRQSVTQKNVQSKENKTVKRKYVRKKGLNKIHTTTAEETAEPAKGSCRKFLDFDTWGRDESYAGSEKATATTHLGKDGVAAVENDLSTSMQEDTQVPSTIPSRKNHPGAKQKENPTAKKKYSRRKALNRSSAPPTEVVTQETNVGLPCDLNSSMPLPEEVQGPSKDSFPKEKTTGKRKYERKKRVNKPSPIKEITEGLHEPLKPGSNKMPRRKSLSFEVRAGAESSEGGKDLNVCVSQENCEQGTFYISLNVEIQASTASPSEGKTTGKRTYTRRKRSKISAELTDSSMPRDTTAPSISPSKCNSTGGKLNVNANSEENKNKRNDKTAVQEGDENCANIIFKSVEQSKPNGSASQMVGSKRKHSGFSKRPDASDMNFIGAEYNCLASYQTKCWVPIPNNQKKTSEKGENADFNVPSSMTTAKEVQLRCPQEEAQANCWIFNSESNVAGAQAREQSFAEFVSILRREMERPITTTRNCCIEANYSTKQHNSGRQTFEAAERPLTCIDAPVGETSASVTRKRQNKKKSALSISADSSKNEMQQHCTLEPGNYHLPLDMWETKHYVDALGEQFRQLNMNTEGRELALHEQKALVAYKQQNIVADGTIIPFEGPFDPIKKHRRPKVDLDVETDRVWKLLMIDINSHGIDGTDEDKTKWWEEERNVFHGRADSFIARMHLVQGDRRFSRWKGSVVDSVVGVFLTQNVSDHLSSSAFMSLAARFPKVSSSTCKTYNGEDTGLAVKEPQAYIVEPEENKECYDHFEEKGVVNTNDSSITASSVTSLTDEPNGKLSESSQRKNEEKEEKSCYEGVRTEINHVVSCQSSVISSQISVDLSNNQNPEKIGSCSDSNSEVEDLSTTAKDHSIHNSTPHEYTLKLTPNSGGLEANFFDPLKSEVSSSGFLENKDENDKNRRFQRTESTSQVEISHSQSTVAQLYPQEQSNHMHQSLFNKSGKNEDLMQKERQLDLGGHKDAVRNQINEVSSTQKKLKSRGREKEKKDDFNWDTLRINALNKAGKREKTENTMDSLDWDAVRCADVSVISDVIKERGMNNRLAERIKNFLNRLVEEHGDIDLEWLRDVPPDQAKEYLLSIRGLGLKSVECVRLLTLHHLAFPVDTNVGRIAVRLGWVPLKPLPESLQLHLLELYPVLESIQKYLWPRLCKLDQRTLYELHYQMITFGKVFCTKSKPNCNACPMRGECRHFASAFASARLSLPGPEQRSIVSTSGKNATDHNPSIIINQLHLASSSTASQGTENQQTEVIRHLEIKSTIDICEPIIEEPTTPEPECSQVSQTDLEDAFIEDSCEIPTIKLNMEEFTLNLQNYMQESMELQEGEMSKALVALNPEAASIPTPKLKNVSRLRTEHSVYELPDTHPLLEGWDRRETDDPGRYLLAIWTPGEMPNSIKPPESKCSSQECGQLCNENECFSCNSFREANSQIVRGTILIPCRTAMQGSFPLNGTYFQVNEVFADHDSSLKPISVPRSWIWNLNRRTVYFGTSMPTIFKGLSTAEIQQCFWRGYVCVRGFDRATRAPRPLMARLHFPASKLPKTKESTRKKSKAAKPQGPDPNPEQQPESLTAAKSQEPKPNEEQQPELLIAANRIMNQGQNPEHREFLSSGNNHE